MNTKSYSGNMDSVALLNLTHIYKVIRNAKNNGHRRIYITVDLADHSVNTNIGYTTDWDAAEPYIMAGVEYCYSVKLLEVDNINAEVENIRRWYETHWV